jgi:hypothetical protein
MAEANVLGPAGADTDAGHSRGEERFFFHMACAMAIVLVAGFSVQLGLGRSTFEVPVVYHLHAVVFFGWIALFLLQTGLIARGDVLMHRRSGWLSALWVPVMIAVGATMTVTSLQRTGGPFFFATNDFLFGNIIGILVFGVLVASALLMRKRTDWHRRLMMCAMAAITGPGFGRLLPMPLLIPWAWELSSLIGLGFVFAGMFRDRRATGRVHPAWFVGLSAIVGWVVIGDVIAATDWGIALTRELLEGHPGAARPMEAYLP